MVEILKDFKFREEFLGEFPDASEISEGTRKGSIQMNFPEQISIGTYWRISRGTSESSLARASGKFPEQLLEKLLKKPSVELPD